MSSRCSVAAMLEGDLEHLSDRLRMCEITRGLLGRDVHDERILLQRETDALCEIDQDSEDICSCEPSGLGARDSTAP